MLLTEVFAVFRKSCFTQALYSRSFLGAVLHRWEYFEMVISFIEHKSLYNDTDTARLPRWNTGLNSAGIYQITSTSIVGRESRWKLLHYSGEKVKPISEFFRGAQYVSHTEYKSACNHQEDYELLLNSTLILSFLLILSDSLRVLQRLISCWSMYQVSVDTKEFHKEKKNIALERTMEGNETLKMKLKNF